MKKIKTILRLLYHLVFKANLVKTLYVNFKKLPFSQAKRLPIFVYGSLKLKDFRGSIEVAPELRFGMVKIGPKNYINTHKNHTALLLGRGAKIIFNTRTNIYTGSYIFVSNNATLTFGNYFSAEELNMIVGSNSKIICFESISLGNQLRSSWEINIIDTSFHYTRGSLRCSDEVKSQRLTKPIVVGDNCWIGFRSTLMKGTKLPSNTIVASNSLCNKDFTANGSFTLLGGMPAKTICSDIERIFDQQIEKQLDAEFGYSRNHLI